MRQWPQALRAFLHEDCIGLLGLLYDDVEAARMYMHRQHVELSAPREDMRPKVSLCCSCLRLCTQLLARVLKLMVVSDVKNVWRSVE